MPLRRRMLVAGRKTLFDHWNAYDASKDGAWTSIGTPGGSIIGTANAVSRLSPFAESPLAATTWGILSAWGYSSAYMAVAARFAVDKAAKSIVRVGNWTYVRNDGPAGATAGPAGVIDDAYFWVTTQAGTPNNPRMSLGLHDATGVTGKSVSSASTPAQGNNLAVKNFPGLGKCLWSVSSGGLSDVNARLVQHNRAGAAIGGQGTPLVVVAGIYDSGHAGFPLSSTRGIVFYPGGTSFPTTFKAREIAFSGLDTAFGPGAAATVTHIADAVKVHVSDPIHGYATANRFLLAYQDNSDARTYLRLVGVNDGVVSVGSVLDITDAMAGATWSDHYPNDSLRYIAEDCALLFTKDRKFLPIQINPTAANDLETLKVGALKTLADDGVTFVASAPNPCPLGKHDIALFAANSAYSAFYGKVLSNGQTE